MDLPPDHSSLKMKILQTSFVANCMSHCLNTNYVPLDPSVQGQKLAENHWESIWFEGYTFPHSVDLLNIAEVLSEEVNETSENGVESEPGESENEGNRFSDSS